MRTDVPDTPDFWNQLESELRAAEVESVKVMPQGEYAENDIVRNTLKRDPTPILPILEALKQAGALKADLVVI